MGYSNSRAGGGCWLKAQGARGNFRRIIRWEREAVLDRMTIRLSARPGILDIRRERAEHPFGSIQQLMHQGAFLMCGLDKVWAEFSLTAPAYNPSQRPGPHSAQSSRGQQPTAGFRAVWILEVKTGAPRHVGYRRLLRREGVG